MENLLKCSNCGKEFIEIDKASEHSNKTKHYEFKIKGIQQMEVLIG